MRSVFQVVATMVLANAAVAYGADAKSAISAAKKGANATVEDAKAKAADVAKGAQTQATEVKATATDAAKDTTKQANASQPAATPATTPASEVKEAAKEAMASQPQDKSELAGARKSSIIPESAVLPESVLRFRAIYGAASSKKGYDANANKIENGIKVTANRAVAVLEYGITERISGQLLMPYSLGGKVTVDDKTKLIETSIRGPVTAAVDAGLAPAIAALGAAYTANASSPADIVLSATLTVPKNTPIKTYLDGVRAALIEKNIAAQYEAAKTTAESVKFQEGLGDIEVGAKYSISTVKEPVIAGVPFYASAGVGVRLNTGKFVDAAKDGKRAAGRGTTDLGIRLNADYEATDGIQLQVENQTELMLAKGKTYVGGKEVDYARDGMRQVGYTKLVIAPGAWIPAADVVLLNARYNWDNDAQTKTDGTANAGTATVGRSAQFGLGFDGLKLKLPVQLDYDYVLAARSRNVGTALDANVVTLKLFYKF